jgi:hypothetical protein
VHTRLYHPPGIQWQDSQRGWCLTWSLAAVLALGLALASPSPVQAKTFHCDAGHSGEARGAMGWRDAAHACAPVLLHGWSGGARGLLTAPNTQHAGEAEV